VIALAVTSARIPEVEDGIGQTASPLGIMVLAAILQGLIAVKVVSVATLLLSFAVGVDAYVHDPGDVPKFSAWRDNWLKQRQDYLSSSECSSSGIPQVQNSVPIASCRPDGTNVW
jgi:hypothetical protein